MALLAFAVLPALAAAAPPAAPKRPVTDHFGATTLIDNYRWMESLGPDLRAYAAAATGHASEQLARLPARERIAHDIETFSAPGTSVQAIVANGETILFLRRGPADDVPRLYVRATDDSHAARMLLDPETLPDAKPHSEIAAFAPSPDGTYVAYTLQDSDPDGATLRILDTAHRRTLPERIRNARFADVAWLGDSSGFYYTAPNIADGRPGAEPGWRRLGIFLHRLHTGPRQDTRVLDAAHLPFAFKGEHIIPRLLLPPGSDYALLTVSDGLSPDIAVFAVPVTQLGQQPAPWVALAPQDSGISEVAVSGSLAFLLSHEGAPTYKILQEDLADPGLENARTVLEPARDGVITGIEAASDALYVARRAGVGMQLLRLDYHEPRPDVLHLPFEGTIAPGYGTTGGAVADSRAAGVVFSLESWTHPRTWLRYDASAHRIMDAGLVPDPPFNLDDYESIETEATASDGTRIPLSLILRRDTEPDHARPTVIEAYGSYGYAYDPRFMPAALAWANQGGVYAIAHVRGGGELGPLWHAAGRFAAKSTTITDLAACADQLHASGYADSAHLALLGRNAGGIAAAGVLTRFPALARAVVVRNGLFDPLRLDPSDSPEAVAEFGAPMTPAETADLLRIDAYEQVKDGTTYPATLLTAQLSDEQVPAWQTAKMAARLAAAAAPERPVLLRLTPAPPQSRAERAASEADELAFLLWQLGTPAFQPGGHGEAPQHR